MMTAANLQQVTCQSAFPQPQPLTGMLTAAPVTTSPLAANNCASSLCSTPVTVLNPNYQPIIHFVQQPPAYQPISTIPPPSIIPPVANVFEGLPIFLLPHSGSTSINGVTNTTLKLNNTKTNAQATSTKVDTSKHFHVFVGDLAPEIDSNALKSVFASYGEISEAKVIRDGQTQKSKGYGFIAFVNKENAEKAIEGMNGRLIGRRQIRTNWASRKPNGSEDNSIKDLSFEQIFNATCADNTSVYVGNLNSSTTEQDLIDVFSTMGTISEVRLFKQQGYAFVRYSIKESAARAIFYMNGKDIKGNSVKCSWGKTPADMTSVSKQTFNGLNFIGNSILGLNPVINPFIWNSNQYGVQFCGQTVVHPWQA